MARHRSIPAADVEDAEIGCNHAAKHRLDRRRQIVVRVGVVGGLPPVPVRGRLSVHLHRGYRILTGRVGRASVLTAGPSSTVAVGDCVGAAELIAWSGAGRVFRSGDAGELGLALLDLARDRRLLATAKRAARAYRPWITPEQAARHLLAVCTLPVGAPEPVAPWASGEARAAILAAREGEGAGLD